MASHAARHREPTDCAIRNRRYTKPCAALQGSSRVYTYGPMNSVRVRFAPSPTGFLHLGGARTALYNWLWARKRAGPSSCASRTPTRAAAPKRAVIAILDSMRWLGLDWDEGPLVGGPHGPYFQMQRLDIYRAFAEQLHRGRRRLSLLLHQEELARARAEHKAAHGQRARFPLSGHLPRPKDPAGTCPPWSGSACPSGRRPSARTIWSRAGSSPSTRASRTR